MPVARKESFEGSFSVTPIESQGLSLSLEKQESSSAAHSAGSSQGTKSNQSFILYLHLCHVRLTADLAARDAHPSRHNKLELKRNTLVFSLLTHHSVERLLENYPCLPSGIGRCSRNNHFVQSSQTWQPITQHFTKCYPSASRWGLWHKAAGAFAQATVTAQ